MKVKCHFWIDYLAAACGAWLSIKARKPLTLYKFETSRQAFERGGPCNKGQKDWNKAIMELQNQGKKEMENKLSKFGLYFIKEAKQTPSPFIHKGGYTTTSVENSPNKCFKRFGTRKQIKINKGARQHVTPNSFRQVSVKCPKCGTL